MACGAEVTAMSHGIVEGADESLSQECDSESEVRS